MSTSKSAKPAYHHGDLAEALVEAALAILEETGDPAQLSLREAARRAGVSAMAPYRHFADKDALFSAVAAIGFARLAEALRAADLIGEPADALVGQGVAYVAFARANPALFRLMFGSVPGGRRDGLAAAREASYAVMAQRVAGIVGAVQGGDWALRCWATAHGLAFLAVDGQLADRREDPTELAERILRLASND